VVSTLSIATLATLGIVSHLRDGSRAHLLGDGDRSSPGRSRGRYCVVAGGQTVSCDDDVRKAMDLRRSMVGAHILDRRSGVRFAGAGRSRGRR